MQYPHHISWGWVPSPTTTQLNPDSRLDWLPISSVISQGLANVFSTHTSLSLQHSIRTQSWLTGIFVEWMSVAQHIGFLLTRLLAAYGPELPRHFCPPSRKAWQITHRRFWQSCLLAVLPHGFVWSIMTLLDYQTHWVLNVDIKLYLTVHNTKVSLVVGSCDTLPPKPRQWEVSLVLWPSTVPFSLEKPWHESRLPPCTYSAHILW